MTENRIRYSEDLESFVISVINRNAQAQIASCPLIRPHNNSPRLCDNVCEYELVSRRFKILLYFYQRSLIPLAAGNKKCHCHGWQGRGKGSRYSIKAIIKNKKSLLLFERQRSSVRQRSAVPRWLTWIRSVPEQQQRSRRCLVNSERSFSQSNTTMKAFAVTSDGAV